MLRFRAKRGYIGPLGDDFPSLFPLLLGLLVFFSSLAMAYMVYDAKDSNVKAMRANVMISRSVRYQLTFDEDYWKYACSIAMGMRTNYDTHLAMWMEYLDDKGQIHIVSFEGYRNLALCPLPDSDEGVDFWGAYVQNPYLVVSDKTKGRYSITMTYPVIWVNDTGPQKLYVPARLVVVTWK